MASYAAVLPDWVILGVQYPDTVMVYASNKLTLADLKLVSFYGMDERIEMCVTGREFIMTAGATYQEALATLFAQWTPERVKRPEVGPGRKGLPR